MSRTSIRLSGAVAAAALTVVPLVAASPAGCGDPAGAPSYRSHGPR